MRTATVLLALLLSSASLRADDWIVDADSRFDFSKVKTFTLRKTSVESTRYELTSPLVLQNLQHAIRTVLMTRGLKEVASGGDLFVDFTVEGQDYVIDPGGRAQKMGTGRGRGGRRGEGPGEDATGSSPPDFSEAALVIDLVSSRQPELLVWRAVYRDTEKTASKLAQKLPEDATKMVGEYPPKRKP